MRAETLVCPRCGSAAGELEYCSTCGLHLYSCPELPTRSEWDRGGRRGLREASRAAPRGERESKSPGLSALLSFVIAGLGQLYAGAWGRGLAYLSGAFAVSWGAAFVVGPGGLWCGLLVAVWAAIDANTLTEKINRDGPPTWEENRAQLPLAGFVGIIAIALMIGALASGMFAPESSSEPGVDGGVRCTTDYYGEVVCE